MELVRDRFDDFGLHSYFEIIVGEAEGLSYRRTSVYRDVAFKIRHKGYSECRDPKFKTAYGHLTQLILTLISDESTLFYKQKGFSQLPINQK